MKKQLIVLTQCLLAICCFGSLTTACQQHHRRPSLFLIPEGYIGWLRIDFGVESAPALSLEDSYYLFKFPPTGIIQTSSLMDEGYAEDKYFYYSEEGEIRRPLTGSISGGTGMIWGETVGRVNGQKEVHQYFFVGTEGEFKEFGLKAKDRDGNPIVGSNKAELP